MKLQDQTNRNNYKMKLQDQINRNNYNNYIDMNT